jgi:rhamnosyltransferase
MNYREAKTVENSVAPRAENICAVIVTYFPDATFYERLERIRNQVNKVVIVDNTENSGSEALGRISSTQDLEIIHNVENLGIGAALNQGVCRALKLGYSWALTFDQDSWIEPDFVETMIRIYEQQTRPELVGIIGCAYEDQITRSVSAPQINHGGVISRETETVITSGSLLSIAAFLSGGPFRSDFFIDFVDYEYCLRLLRMGYKVITSTKPLMVHALGDGNLRMLESPVGKVQIVLTNRSPLRRYYMTRNALLVARQYLTSHPKWVLRTLASIAGFAILKIPLENDRRTRKVLATLYGAFDAVRSRTGKVEVAWLKK